MNTTEHETECEMNRCPGLFIDAETREVTRCDTCRKFESDEDAVPVVRALLEMLAHVLDTERDGNMTPPARLTVADALDIMEKRVRGVVSVTHTKDADCTLKNDTCTTCGVYHDPPCVECGGRGFHAQRCDR